MGLEPKFVTIRGAAKMLNRSVRTIRHWIHSNRIDAVKDSSGYKWMIRLSDIERIVEERHADKN